MEFGLISKCSVAVADILAGKKKAYSDVARLINCTKDELDQSLTRLNRLREMRECEGNLFVLIMINNK